MKNIIYVFLLGIGIFILYSIFIKERVEHKKMREEFGAEKIIITDYIKEGKLILQVNILNAKNIIANTDLKNRSGHASKILFKKYKEYDDYRAVEIVFKSENTPLLYEIENDTVEVESINYLFDVQVDLGF